MYELSNTPRVGKRSVIRRMYALYIFLLLAPWGHRPQCNWISTVLGLRHTKTRYFHL